MRVVISSKFRGWDRRSVRVFAGGLQRPADRGGDEIAPGISLHLIYALAWSIATLTGGTAGMLLSLNTALDQTMVVIGLKAFPAALVGGLDSLAGAILGALIIATAEVLVIQFVSPLLADVVPFIVLLAMLIVRPWGLFGTREELDRV